MIAGAPPTGIDGSAGRDGCGCSSAGHGRGGRRGRRHGASSASGASGASAAPGGVTGARGGRAAMRRRAVRRDRWRGPAMLRRWPTKSELQVGQVRSTLASGMSIHGPISIALRREPPVSSQRPADRALHAAFDGIHGRARVSPGTASSSGAGRSRTSSATWSARSARRYTR